MHALLPADRSRHLLEEQGFNLLGVLVGLGRDIWNQGKRQWLNREWGQDLA